MFNAVQDYTLSILPSKKKTSQSGWLSFNAICCQHNGHNVDTRGRGGIKTNGDGHLSYHCFNCGFKTSYTPGRALSFKYRRFLKWLGADSAEIQRLIIETLRLKDLVNPDQIREAEPEEEITFKPRSLPKEAVSFLALAEFYELANKQYPTQFVAAVNYMSGRKIDLQRYDFYWTPEVENKLNHRVIVPFKYKGDIVGYTARAVNDSIKPKYHSDQPPHFVFNLDNQRAENKFVIVVEGPFDAMAIDGVSTQTNEISMQQADLIERLGKKIIYVPDFDRHVNKQGRDVWPGYTAVEQALDYGWAVSFPVWHTECKDVSRAVELYGKLFVLKSILAAAETNPLKIKILANKI